MESNWLHYVSCCSILFPLLSTVINNFEHLIHAICPVFICKSLPLLLCQLYRLCQIQMINHHRKRAKKLSNRFNWGLHGIRTIRRIIKHFNWLSDFNIVRSTHLIVVRTVSGTLHQRLIHSPLWLAEPGPRINPRLVPCRDQVTNFIPIANKLDSCFLIVYN